MSVTGVAWRSQYEKLSKAECPNTHGRASLREIFEGQNLPAPKHGLQEFYSRPWRRWFRKTYWWGCHFCDLKVRSARVYK